MKKIKNIITILTLLATLHSCGLFKTTQKEEVAASEETAQQLWTGYTAPKTVATNVRYEIDLDTMTGNGYTFEIPESMNADIDSLLNSW